ncbi:MAG: hypothetical protein ACOH2F_00215 [Cellulomonas sp.]
MSDTHQREFRDGIGEIVRVRAAVRSQSASGHLEQAAQRPGPARPWWRPES